MFLVLLKFADNKDKAGQLMDAHNQWIKRGFDEGVFVLAGSLQPQRGGAILAHGTSLTELQARIDADPFVAACRANSSLEATRRAAISKGCAHRA
jgi:uncharacterized protein YciI